MVWHARTRKVATLSKDGKAFQITQTGLIFYLEDITGRALDSRYYAEGWCAASAAEMQRWADEDGYAWEATEVEPK